MEDKTGLYILLALLGITVVGVLGFVLWSSGTVAGGGIVSTPCKNAPAIPTDLPCEVQLDYFHRFKKGQKVKVKGESWSGISLHKIPCVSSEYIPGYQLLGGDTTTICSDSGVLDKKYDKVLWLVCGLRKYDNNTKKWAWSNDCGWIEEEFLTEA